MNRGKRNRHSICNRLHYLNISAGDHTTTEDSLDGGVTLTSKTEVQNCEWIGSAYQCGQATSGQDSYSTTVTILDENDKNLQQSHKTEIQMQVIITIHIHTQIQLHIQVKVQESGSGNGLV